METILTAADRERLRAAMLMVRTSQRLTDYQGFLRRLRHEIGSCCVLWLLLDRHGSRYSLSSLHLTECWASACSGCRAIIQSSTQ